MTRERAKYESSDGSTSSWMRQFGDHHSAPFGSIHSRDFLNG